MRSKSLNLLFAFIWLCHVLYPHVDGNLLPTMERSISSDILLVAPLHSTSLTSRHSTPLHFTSRHFTSLHFTSLHFTSRHFTSLHFLHFSSLQRRTSQVIQIHVELLMQCISVSICENHFF